MQYCYKTFSVLDIVLIKIDVHCRLYSWFAKLTIYWQKPFVTINFKLIKRNSCRHIEAFCKRS